MIALFRRVSSFDNDIDFTRMWRGGLVVAAAVVLVSLGALAFRGLDLGIDFVGGDSWEVPGAEVSVADARDALAPVGQEGAQVQVIGDDTLRVQTESLELEAREEVTAALAELTGVDAQAIGVSTVGPSWGDEITEQAVRALIAFLVIITVYLAIRLEWQMAAGALVALVHDIVVSVGVYALFGFEVTPATVIAFLTILGFSLYDTIVVFDKVHDNQARVSVSARMTYSDLMSLSLNQVLMRSINTAITSLLPVVAMLVVGSFLLGAVTLQEFAVALAVGILTGVYSSIFVAAPVVVAIREREPRYRALRQRLEAQAPTGPVEGERAPMPAGVGSSAGPAPTSQRSAGAAPRPGPRPTTTAIPPRPRKKGRRR